MKPSTHKKSSKLKCWFLTLTLLLLPESDAAAADGLGYLAHCNIDS